jgi:hypothetical protein
MILTAVKFHLAERTAIERRLSADGTDKLEVSALNIFEQLPDLVDAFDACELTWLNFVRSRHICFDFGIWQFLIKMEDLNDPTFRVRDSFEIK